MIVVPIPHPRSSTSPVFESTFFLRIVLHGKAQMGEVWDHPNRKKVWLGFGGIYSGVGGSAGLPWTSIVLDCKETLRAVDRSNLPKSRIFSNFPGAERGEGETGFFLGKHVS